VVGHAGQRAGVGEPVAGGGEVGERLDLPREVVEPDGAVAGTRRAGLEQAEVVVVGGVPPAQERPAREVERQPLEAEDVAVEGDAALDVRDEQDGVVQAADRRGGSQVRAIAGAIDCPRRYRRSRGRGSGLPPNGTADGVSPGTSPTAR
jgi:hypothetical protein